MRVGVAARPTEDIKQAVAAQQRLASKLFDALEVLGRDEPGVTRASYGPAENSAHELVADCAAQLGLTVTRDAAANTYMTFRGADPGAPAILIGSHLDSVAHGGNYDGAAGVVAGLTAIAALKGLAVRPTCNITVMGIRAEESVWFQVSYVGSRSALGTLPPGALDAKRIDTQRTLADHIAECGGDPEAIRKGMRFLDPASIRAFLELHIEQAPSLVEAGKAVAICTGIPGNFRYPAARIEGQYAHVGLPRRFRRDAALAASDFAMALDRIWEEHDNNHRALAITMGRFHTDASAHGLTIVPGNFHFSLDVRAYDQDFLAELEREVVDAVTNVERRRGVRFHLGPRASAAVGPVDPNIRASLESCAAALAIPAIALGSPASHDAAAFAACRVPIGMIFVRNENGSHNPAEAMSIEDFLSGVAILTSCLVEASS